MRRLEIEGELDWIPGFTTSRLPCMDGTTVVLAQDLLPADLQAHARLLHPIHEDLGCADAGLLWEEPWDERYGRGRADSPFAARGLKWHDLAHELDLDFGPGFQLADFLPALPAHRWPRRLVGPEDGDLDVDTVHHLMRLLRPYTGDRPCLHYWPASRSRDGHEQLYEAPLSSLLSLHADPLTRSSPTALWPRDRSWLFLGPPDLPFSLLSGPEALIEDLLRDKPLDGVQIRLSQPLQQRPPPARS